MLRSRSILLMLLLVVPAVRAQDATPTPGSSGMSVPATPPVITAKSPALWDNWFKMNTTVTDKTDYVHFFWNAQDYKAYFNVKEKKPRLAEAALQLVQRLAPADSKADLMKVDIVYVLERDSYGMPKWDSLERVAHFEFSKAGALKNPKRKPNPPEGSFKKLFGKVEFF